MSARCTSRNARSERGRQRPKSGLGGIACGWFPASAAAIARQRAPRPVKASSWRASTSARRASASSRAAVSSACGMRRHCTWRRSAGSALTAASKARTAPKAPTKASRSPQRSRSTAAAAQAACSCPTSCAPARPGRPEKQPIHQEEFAGIASAPGADWPKSDILSRQNQSEKPPNHQILPILQRTDGAKMQGLSFARLTLNLGENCAV
uniref:Uncharacterized protein n=1 Tax=Spironucleus salmonicida TaxID=348837 RepID=V6LS11_9EUKA|eukprot:EST47048.1 Hypothetical protein SS50377_12895 [Spironucleus salmonicida]